MHSVTEALQILRLHSAPAAPRSLPVSDALGCILAAPVIADSDCPPFHRAIVDGYALRSTDTAPTPASLTLIAHQDAGAPLFTGTLAPGQCVSINTGAPVPPGADAVIMVEDTTIQGSTVAIRRTLAPGANIQPRAADAAKNSTLLPAGTLLGPAQLAVAAAAGCQNTPPTSSPIPHTFESSGGVTSETSPPPSQTLSVIPSPRVALLVTGDELVPSHLTPGPGQIRNVNTPMLTALLLQSHASLISSATSPDNSATLRAHITSSLATADLLIVTGAMSMGTKDLVPPLLLELGIQLHLQKVRIKPGKPFLFGTLTNPHFAAALGAAPPSPSVSPKYIIGLPGNPVSAFVCFHRFVRPLLARLAGLPEPALLTAPLAAPLPANTDREFYQPARLENGSLVPLTWRGSADIFTLAQANALLILPPNSPAHPATTLIPFLPL